MPDMIPISVCVSLILRAPDETAEAPDRAVRLPLLHCLEIVMETGEELEQAYDLLNGKVVQVFVKGTSPA